MLDLISTDAPHLCSNCGNDTKLTQISSCSSNFERKKPQRNTSGIMVGFLFAYLTMNVALLSERVYLLIICFQKKILIKHIFGVKKAAVFFPVHEKATRWNVFHVLMEYRDLYWLTRYILHTGEKTIWLFPICSLLLFCSKFFLGNRYGNIH